jgi:hypothetical protein
LLSTGSTLLDILYAIAIAWFSLETVQALSVIQKGRRPSLRLIPAIVLIVAVTAYVFFYHFPSKAPGSGQDDAAGRADFFIAARIPFERTLR